MKYIIQADVDAHTGAELEAHPENIQAIMGKWEAVNPIGMYFSIARRRVTIIVEAPNEDAFFEALHATWVGTKTYPEVWPVVGAEEFPRLLQRAGVTP